MLSSDTEVIKTPDSTSIRVIGYSETTKTLFIKFISGDQTYEWYNVPLTVWDGFKTTVADGGSVGKYYHKNVRGQYDSMCKTLSYVSCGV